MRQTRVIASRVYTPADVANAVSHPDDLRCIVRPQKPVQQARRQALTPFVTTFLVCPAVFEAAKLSIMTYAELKHPVK